jgi:hypothetical protein
MVRRRLTGGGALLVASFGVFAAAPRARARTEPVFPADYRSWVHVKSALVGPRSPAFATEGGIHHVYANHLALQGLRAGSFPDGSVLVYDLLATEEQAGITTEGPRRRVDVMTKDTRSNPGSAGWVFERYLGDDRDAGTLTTEERAACFACHSNRQSHDHVFSEFRP